MSNASISIGSTGPGEIDPKVTLFSESNDAPIEDVELTQDDRFRFLASEYHDAVEALRETHDELTPAAIELDSLDHVWSGIFAESRRLTEEDRLLLNPVFQNLPEDGLVASQFVDRVWEAVEHTDWGPTFTLAMMRRIYRPRRQPIFHNAILISTVAAFEAHLSKLAAEYYRSAPEALHNVPREAVKEFSLRELQSMDSIQDAVEMAIEQRVTALMFGSLTDWKKFFSDRMNIDMTTLSNEWDFVCEVFERRHCIVHSEAKASRRYTRVFTEVELHSPLHADAPYVARAIEALELLGLLLHASIWSKFAVEDKDVIDATERIGFASLKAERWLFSFHVYEYWAKLKLPEAEQRMAKVNLWIARKNLHGMESIRSEVVDWDVSGSDEVYEFAKLCLLDDLDAAFAMLPKLIERDKVGGEQLATWPLIAPLRADSRIQDYVELMKDYLSDEAASSADAKEEEEEAETISDPAVEIDSLGELADVSSVRLNANTEIAPDEDSSALSPDSNSSAESQADRK